MASKEYHKEYNLKRYHTRMNRMREALGGKCIDCGSTEDLQIDHKNPQEMSFRLGLEWDRKWSEIEEELKKCQLLCRSCHNNKTVNDLGQTKAAHGTHAFYTHHKCRCVVCKAVHTKYMREYKQKRKHGRIG